MRDMNGKVEVHIKYMGEWLCSTAKDNVKGEHIGHAVNLLALEIQRSLEQMLEGNLNIKKLPKTKSHGLDIGIIIPEDKRGGE